MSLTISHILLWVLVAFNSVAICVLLRYLVALRQLAGAGQTMVTDSGLRVGEEAPAFTAIDLRSEQMTESYALRGRRRTMVFVSTDCIVCRRMVSELSSIEEGWLDLLVYCHGTRRECHAELRDLPPSIRVLVGVDDGLVSLYGLTQLPAVVVLSEALVVEAIDYPTEFSELRPHLTKGTLGHANALEESSLVGR